MLYEKRVDASWDSLKSRLVLQEKIEAIGYEVVTDRGDYREE